MEIPNIQMADYLTIGYFSPSNSFRSYGLLLDSKDYRVISTINNIRVVEIKYINGEQELGEERNLTKNEISNLRLLSPNLPHSWYIHI